MIKDNPHTLQPNEVSQLIKDGLDLNDSGNHMYVMRFGWNNDWNKAADPAPFKINSHLNKKLREDAMGMPYVIPKYGIKKHIRNDDNTPEPKTAAEQLKAILDVQSKYAIGEIQGSLEYDTGNVWLIIDIWPEFQAGVERGYYPPLVSPTFNIIQNGPDGVDEAQFLNLQGVPTSGYSPEFTQIESVCKNGIKECMAEMKIHGAAGTIKSSGFAEKSFSSIINGVVEAMSEQENSPALEDRVGNIEKAVADLTAVVKQLVDKGSTGDSESSSEIAGAAGNAELKKQNELLLKEKSETKTKLDEMKNDLSAIKKDKEAENKTFKEKTIASILERELRGKEVKDEQKSELIKSYMDMDLEVLTLLDDKLKAAIPEATKESQISGAYGKYTPETTTESDRPKNSEMTV